MKRFLLLDDIRFCKTMLDSGVVVTIALLVYQVIIQHIYTYTVCKYNRSELLSLFLEILRTWRVGVTTALTYSFN